MQKKSLIIVLILFLFFSSILPILISNANEASVSYQVHVKGLGWINPVADGEIGGTTGQSRRMEAIKINLSGVDGELTYKVHGESYGWQQEVGEGELAGTTGQSKRLEAIMINLNNSSYNIRYRVHVRGLGWMNWVNSGEVAGTTGQSRRIEAIQIVLEKKENLQENSNEEVKNTEINNKNNDDNNIDNEKAEENQGIEEKSENSTENKTVYSGIDVSKYQGVIDWGKVKKSGIDFTMIRCGYRGFTAGTVNEDVQFLNNIRGAYSNGVKAGIYFYSSAVNEDEAREEANYVLSLINKYSVKECISYPIAIDIEDFEGTRNYNLSVLERTNVVKAFCNVIQNAGYEPMVYSYTYFLENKLYMDELVAYDTWIADYYGNTWYNRGYSIWQYTDKGQVDGIAGDVDMNYSYKKY